MSAKTAKILVAALVLAGASITFIADASAAPAKGPNPEEVNWMNRASGPDGGAYGP
jgi:ABC-type glycerol-3-phosphate transport system substrate-binding protein